MKRNKAFTLIEILVVIGIILVLMGILLPILAHANRVAQIKAEELDFQSISSALENYKQDFGDYPRNSALPAWSPTVNGPAPTYMGLATALLGPGPAVTGQVLSSNNVAEAGDGASQFGFCARTTVVPEVLANQASAGATSLTTVNALPTLTSSNEFVTFNDANGANEGEVGIASMSGTTIGLSRPTTYTHNANTPIAIRTPTGKVWGPYLTTDRYKTAYTAAYSNVGNQPLLLDRWGAPVQYFVRHGNNSNRTGNSLAFPIVVPGVQGPLYGYCEPGSVDTNGLDSIWDARDGTLNQPPATGVDESIAFKWMLGDEDQDNLIDHGETLHYTGGFILISAGPDSASAGTNPATGLPYSRFCNMYSVPQLTPEQMGALFTKSGNIYNFER